MRKAKPVKAWAVVGPGRLGIRPHLLFETRKHARVYAARVYGLWSGVGVVRVEVRRV